MRTCSSFGDCHLLACDVSLVTNQKKEHYKSKGISLYWTSFNLYIDLFSSM